MKDAENIHIKHLGSSLSVEGQMAGHSKTKSLTKKADQKHKPPDVFDFPDDSAISSIDRLGENEQDEEPYEAFAPPLHSTAIYADEEEFSKQCGSSIPSTPQGKEARRSLNTSENEASESVKNHAKELGGKLKPVIDVSESTEKSDVTKDKPAEKRSTQQHEATPAMASSELSGKPAKLVTPKKTGPLNAQSSVENETQATESQQQKIQKKRKMSHGKGKKSRSKDVDSDSDIFDSAFIWCLEGKKTNDIMELGIVLSAFEKTLLEYKQRIESRVCKEAINEFYSIIKEELIKMIKEVQILKNLKRKNAKHVVITYCLYVVLSSLLEQSFMKMISGIKRKRQRLIEVQDELLW
ncbi:centromere protein U isoform X2 [Trichechus manatus latirostris]|uniref:Centromere protein U n=2 Tax=Trichechus manatus latirostris TaxID=127582 RepID=A0A2Y9QM70_TRIMA|nr:centromere protein U isoform X2 [Trichechus manatus latirostris]